MIAKGSHGPRVRIGALKLWAKTNSDGLWNIAAYHRADSITWRWILSLSIGRRFRGDDGKWKPRWFVWHKWGALNGNGQANVSFGSVSIGVHWQPNMIRERSLQ